MEEKKQLYLIDAMALIFRSYYALNKNPRINSKGMNTSAVLGFANSLLDIIKHHNPTHLGVAFDLHEITIRKQDYEDYKANRQAAPEDILSAIPYVKRLIEAMNIPYLACPGYEADDVIGTLAKKAAKTGFQVFMVTPDKDYAQLVDENIFILKLPYMGSKEQIWGIEDVKQRFEVKRCEQVIDILGLWGDSVDNIPGVPSIGEKKAKALMQQFDSIEDIIANSSQIESKSVRKAIEENTDKALLSKKLATIMLDCPIEFDSKALEISKPNVEACKALFSELEFNAFAERFFKTLSIVGANDSQSQNKIFEQPKPENKTQQSLANVEQQELFFATFDDLSVVKHNYSVIETREDYDKLLQRIEKEKAFSFFIFIDKDGIDSEAKCFSISFEGGDSFFVLVKQNKEIFYANKEIFSQNKEIFQADKESLKSVFENEKTIKICQDIKQSKHALLNCDVQIKGECNDVMIAHYLLQSEERHDIEFLTQKYLKYNLISPSDIGLKSLKNMADAFENIPLDKQKNYICEKSHVLIRLWPLLYEELKENQMVSLFKDVEMPLSNVLFAMEREGVSINIEELNIFSGQLDREKQALEEKIYSLAGREFNISSPKQLSEVLYQELQIVDKVKKSSKTKAFSTAEDVLVKLVEKHPIVQLILDYRSLAKLKGTYVDALPLLVNKKTNRLHTTFNQTIASTGRLSSTNPNLQNIPVRTALGRQIRKAFVAKNNDYAIMSADYSQIELRIIASLSKDEHMCKAFNENMDIHLATAAKIYKISTDEVTKEMRSRAKSVNFGIIYGISSFGLSEQLHIPRKEATDLINEYFIQYPQIRLFIDTCIKEAEDKGYAQTILGRRRYLNDINSRNANLRNFAQRNAVNMPIQGSSADMIKKAMITIHKEIQERNLVSRMLLQVHDELVFEVYKKEEEELKAIVEKAMTNALVLENVPILVEIKTAANWLQAH